MKVQMMTRFSPLLLALLLPGSALALDLAEAMQLAVKHNPNLRAAIELEVQARTQRDQAWAFIQPTISAGYQFRVNDREIAFDAASSFDTSALTDAFEPIFGNLGFIYGEMFQAGWIDGDDCNDLAVLNGFADCTELTDAFLNGGGIGADDGGDDQEPGEPLVVQPKTQQFLNLQAQWPLSPRAITMHQAGQRGVEGSRARVRQSRDQLLLGVVQAYGGAWQVQESVKVLADQVSLAEAHLADTEALSNAGMITRDILLRAQLELERTRRTLSDTEQSARSAQRSLRMLIGRPDLTLGELAPLPDIAIARADLDGLADEAEAGRPEVSAAVADAGAARAMKADAVLQFLPQLAVTGALNWSDQAAGFDSKRTSWWIGVGVNIPIWDGGIKIHNTRAAASRQRQAEAQIEAVRMQVATEVENAWDRYETKRGAIKINQLERDLAAEAYRLVEVRFRAGGTRQVELLDAQTQLALAELGLVRAKADEQLAAAELLAAAGRVNEVTP
ncbi:MAG: TolC family protein [Deltaproteobacteria bacterium]|nr:TolC family protein [Deltaproteobacteria bacterium]